MWWWLHMTKFAGRFWADSFEVIIDKRLGSHLAAAYTNYIRRNVLCKVIDSLLSVSYRCRFNTNLRTLSNIRTDLSGARVHPVSYWPNEGIHFVEFPRLASRAAEKVNQRREAVVEVEYRTEARLCNHCTFWCTFIYIGDIILSRTIRCLKHCKFAWNFAWGYKCHNKQSFMLNSHTTPTLLVSYYTLLRCNFSL